MTESLFDGVSLYVGGGLGMGIGGVFSITSGPAPWLCVGLFFGMALAIGALRFFTRFKVVRRGA